MNLVQELGQLALINEGDASDDHGNCANNGDVDERDTGCEES